MRKTNFNVYFICLSLAFIGLYSCNSDEKTDAKEADGAVGQIVLVFEDSNASKFFQQRKAVFKYLDDNQLPVEISFNSNETTADLVIKTERQSLDLVYSDNSQVEF